MPEPTLVEAVTGLMNELKTLHRGADSLQNDLTTLHRQIDAACLEIRHLRTVNAELLEACTIAERVFRVPAGTDTTAEIMALSVLRCAIQKAGE